MIQYKSKKQKQRWWKNLSDEEKETYIKKKQKEKAKRRRKNPLESKEYPWITPETKRDWLKKIKAKNPWLQIG